jgi:hypothetical protein
MRLKVRKDVCGETRSATSLQLKFIARTNLHKLQRVKFLNGCEKLVPVIIIATGSKHRSISMQVSLPQIPQKKCKETTRWKNRAKTLIDSESLTSLSRGIKPASKREKPVSVVPENFISQLEMAAQKTQIPTAIS